MSLIPAALLSFFQSNAYIILFFLMIIEGPIVTYAAAIAAAAGQLNVWIVFILSIFGNLIPDTLLFLAGGLFKKKTVEKFVEFFGLKKEIVKWLEKHVHNHAVKIITIVKLVPPLPVPGLLLVGFLRVPFKKFMWVNVIFNIVFAAIFTLLGYYSGIGIATVTSYLKLTEYLLPIALILVIVFYFVFRRLYAMLGNYIQKNQKI